MSQKDISYADGKWFEEIEKDGDISKLSADELVRLSEIKKQLDESKDKSDSEDKPKRTKQQIQSDKALEFLMENYSFCLGADGRLYYGDRVNVSNDEDNPKFVDTHVMSSDSEYLEKDVELFSQGNAIQADKKVAENAVALVKRIEEKSIDRGLSVKRVFEPRIYKSKVDNSVWIDSAYGSNLSSFGHGFIRLDPETGTWEDRATPADDVYFSRSKLTGEMKIDTKNRELSNVLDMFKYANCPQEMWGPVIASIITKVVEPKAACPILYIQGEGGTGKSTFAEIVKSIFDPAVGGQEVMAGFPANDDDATIRFDSQAWVIYDNITGIPQVMSDLACRVATGGGQIKRELYTNSSPVITSYLRNQIITSVEPVTMKSDLQTRSVYIKPDKLKTASGGYGLTSRNKSKWEDAAPAVRSGFLTLAAKVLQLRESKLAEADETGIELEFNSRLSDYHFTMQLVDEVMKEAGLFEANYSSEEAKKRASMTLMFDSIPDIIAFMVYSDEVTELKGTPTQILSQVRQVAGESGYPVNTWGEKGRWMASALSKNRDVLAEHFEIEDYEYRGQRSYSLKKKNQAPTKKSENKADYIKDIII